MKTFLALLALTGSALAQFITTNINGPAGSGTFGTSVTVLPNGNFVVTDPSFDLSSPAAVADVGAVYLYSASGTLLNTLTGSQAGDQVGITGVVVLADGNYVVQSRLWDNGAVADAGAATWCSASGGPDRVVSAANSMVGGSAGDQVGKRVQALSGGRYLLRTQDWDNGAQADAGAVTWCAAGGGTVGVVSSANSLVGASASDFVASSTLELNSGAVVVVSQFWDNGAATDAGAVTLVTSLSGMTGTISSSNSLVGTHTDDAVGFNVVTLSNGNLLVVSKFWNGNRGAVTWMSGTTGLTGDVSSTNSLVGQVANDNVGSNVRALTNGNYVESSPDCDIGGIVDAGAATFGNGTFGVTGNPSSANSLVGGTTSDRVGISLVALSNGNYVVGTPDWDDPALVVANVGAVTWCSGSTGRTGLVTAADSLIGSTANDQVGGSVFALTGNGNYIVGSPNWDNGAITNAGAVTWGNGATGTTGVVSASNSLVGSTASDGLGGFAGGSALVRLTNGNYVVASPNWDDGAISNVGAATWCDGSTGRTGTISSSNSLIGSTSGDAFGSITVALSNGNFVTMSQVWDDGAVANVGAAAWGNGSTGTSGVVSSANALTGSTANDRVGSNIFGLGNGSYVVCAPLWDNGTAANAGAATWCDGAIGRTGVVSPANSLVGSTANDGISAAGVFVFSDSNFALREAAWDNGTNVDEGIVFLGNGSSGSFGPLSTASGISPATASVALTYRSTSPKALIVGNAALNRVTMLSEQLDVISFSNGSFTVAETGGTLNVTLTRGGGASLSQSVTLNTTAGTATANADYRGITNQVINFGVGVSTVTVPITILSGNALNEPNETFALTLSSPTNGATLGAISSATITIVETNSSTAGAPVITAPAASAVLDIASGTTTLSGSATDTDGVSSVEVSLNGGAFVAATLTPASGTNVSWSLDVTPVAGRNDIFVRAIDALSNVSPIASRSFIVRRKLAVTVSGPGTVANGFVPDSFRLIGSTVSITVKANAGALFNGWTAGGPSTATASITQTMLDQPTINVVFKEGLTLTANFAANPFSTANTGVFNGIVTADATLPDRAPAGAGPEDGTTSGVSTEGAFAITVLPAATFTGKLSIDGLALSVAGSFDANGIAHFGATRARTLFVPRTGKPSLSVTMTLSGSQITGTVSALDFAQNIVAVSNFASQRAAFNAANLVSASFLGTANAPQTYTCLLPYIEQSAQIAGQTSQTYPQGDGIGSITLTKLGAINAALTLADGTVFTSSTTADAAMNFRLFAPLYSNRGYLLGAAQLNLADPDSDVLAATAWRWTKPQDLTKQHYPAGWTHLKVNFLGAKYANTAGTSVLKAVGGFDLSPVDPLGNATLSFNDGALFAALEETLNVSSKNLAGNLPLSDASFKTTITASSGRVAGTFTHTDGSTPAYQAIILQKGANAGARGFFLTVKPKVVDFTGQSGGVTLLGR